MTKTEHIIIFFRGIISIFLALLLILAPREGLPVVLRLISISMSISGLRSLIYYITMARSAVGGKMVLFQGIFFLDVGVSIWALADNLSIYLVIYIAAMNIFAGLVAVLRGRESRSTGSRHWRLTTAYGVTSILMAAIVMVSCFGLRRTDLTIYAYAVGMAYSGALQIIASTRRTAIIYIQ